MARPLKATSPNAPHGVLKEQCSSPVLLLALVGQAAMRGLRDALTAENLKPRQFQLLRLLHDEGPLGQRELGERLEIDPSILVTHLNPLEEDGLVSRVRDPSDRRVPLPERFDLGQVTAITAAIMSPLSRVQRALTRW